MEKTYLEQVGSRIRLYRHRMDLSRKDLANLAGVRTSVVLQMENGDSSVTLEDVVKICKALNRSTDHILTGEMGISEWISLCRRLQYIPELDSDKLREVARAFWETCPHSVR